MVLFRFRPSFFATERCCLRLAAASGLVANCRITVKYIALLNSKTKTCLSNASSPPLTLYPQHTLPDLIVGDSKLGCINFLLNEVLKLYSGRLELVCKTEKMNEIIYK